MSQRSTVGDKRDTNKGRPASDRGQKLAKNRTTLVQKITDIHAQAVKKGVDRETVKKVLLESFKGLTSDINGNKEKSSKVVSGKKGPNVFKSRTCLTSFAVIVVLFAVLLGTFLYSYDIRSLEDLSNFKDDMLHARCLVDNNGFMIEVARPLVKCAMCAALTEVPIERNISLEQFKQRYAYSGTPVLVKDATSDWQAMTSFSFLFFKELYNDIDGALESVEEECQFFPYKTSFTTLAEVFNMSDARATFQPGEVPWYIGWSNCNKQVQKRLREHYQRPYFLPNDSESSVIDWMFMGGSGPGAFVHLDYVQRPSWQAQISGRKTWTLVPAPECEATCHSMNVTVEKGDIFVIDTNVWYHSTFIHPGEISITIGSEYD